VDDQAVRALDLALLVADAVDARLLAGVGAARGPQAREVEREAGPLGREQRLVLALALGDLEAGHAGRAALLAALERLAVAPGRLGRRARLGRGAGLEELVHRALELALGGVDVDAVLARV
jgi:hypothetical protein